MGKGLQSCLHSAAFLRYAKIFLRIVYKFDCNRPAPSLSYPTQISGDDLVFHRRGRIR
jgi:hypothetical protein